MVDVAAAECAQAVGEQLAEGGRHVAGARLQCGAVYDDE